MAKCIIIIEDTGDKGVNIKMGAEPEFDVDNLPEMLTMSQQIAVDLIKFIEANSQEQFGEFE